MVDAHRTAKDADDATRSVEQTAAGRAALDHHVQVSAGSAVAQSLYEVSRPIIDRALPGVGYLAARLGSGSDVLGFDDDRSRDHDFGCRLTVLVDEQHQALLATLDAALDAELPEEVAGWPTRFATSWDSQVRHKIDLHTVHDFVASRVGFDLRDPLHPAEWLCLTGQSVLEVTGGPVFHDSTEYYSTVKAALRWYPEDPWRYVLAAGWARLGQELPLVGRTGELGDDSGSRIVAARLCRDITHLSFVVARTWMPYPKWIGKALKTLPGGQEVQETLGAVQAADRWPERQQLLSIAVEALADRHRVAGFELPEPTIVPFFDRPFTMPNGEIVAALADGITDPSVRDLPPIGSIEQWCDNVDVLSHPNRRVRATVLYQR